MFYPALWGSKLYYQLFVNHRNSDRMGLVAQWLDPQFLSHIARPPIVIGVSGTNGKTTTTNFLYQMFVQRGYRVACNRGGANIRPGISRALALETTPLNQSKVDVAIIEFDENTAERLITPLRPDYIVVTNLSTDMVSYSGNVDNSFAHLNSAITPGTTLVLNADDLISSQLGTEQNRRVYYSIPRLPGEPRLTDSLICDVRVCPKCSHKMEYDFRRYNHIGHAHCPNCGFTNPTPDYVLTDPDPDAATLAVNGERYHMIDPGIHNLYNELAAIALAREFGLPDVQGAVAGTRLPAIRFYDDHVGGHHLVSQLAKGENPIAISRTLDGIVRMPGTKEVIVCLDDKEIAEDDTISEMISYIYGVDFECLGDPSVTKVVFGGAHCHDYEVRLLVGGVDTSKMEFVEDEMDTWRHLDYQADNIVLMHGMGIQFAIREVYDRMREQLERGAAA